MKYRPVCFFMQFYGHSGQSFTENCCLDAAVGTAVGAV